MKTNDILKKLDELIPNPKCALNYSKDYELLISVMLSAQSTDARVNIIAKDLYKHSLSELANMDISEIENIIRSVGTYSRKALYLKAIATKLITECDGKVPHDRTYVESLPGVGHKTCNVVFGELFNEPAIAVDTHVTRVSKRLGFSKPEADVKEIEKDLTSLFPKEKWIRVNNQLILFGRHFCKSKNPACLNCPFKSICKEKDLK